METSGAALPELIDDAAQRLVSAKTVAEVLEVKQAAGVAYDAAKSAARLATTKSNVDEIRSAARRAQADALQIESLAEIRLVNEYEAAQQAGDVAGQGRQTKVPDGDLCLPVTLADIGLTKQELHRARLIRNAEVEEPGIVARALQARFESGENPNRAFLRKLVSKGGSRAAVGNERNANAANPNDENLYQTPWVAVDVLHSVLDLSGTIWEPAIGPGAIAERLLDHGLRVVGSDLVDYSADLQTGEVNPIWEQLEPVVADFRELEKHPFGRKRISAIVTNPPYNKADEFIHKALDLAGRHKIGTVAMLLRLNFMAGCGEKRCRSLDDWKPSRQIILSRRLPMMHREDFDGEEATSRLDTCWLIWERDKVDVQFTAVERCDWKHELMLNDEQVRAITKGAGPETIEPRLVGHD